MDRLTKEQRRRNMQANRSVGTKTEMLMRAALRQQRLSGYRVNYRQAPGRPDVAFTRWKLAVFVDGCFWHGCPECYQAPQTNIEYWLAKVRRNRQRDRDVDRRLAAEGWVVQRFWEHEVRRDAADCAAQVGRALAQLGHPRSA